MDGLTVTQILDSLRRTDIKNEGEITLEVLNIMTQVLLVGRLNE